MEELKKNLIPVLNLPPVTISVAETAKLLGMSRPSIYQLIQQGGFPAFKLGGRMLVDYELLKEWSKKQVKASNEMGISI